MLYQKTKISEDKLIIADSKEINQNELTSECWLIQLEGLKACEACECNGTDECGGERIQKILRGKQ